MTNYYSEILFQTDSAIVPKTFFKSTDAISYMESQKTNLTLGQYAQLHLHTHGYMAQNEQCKNILRYENQGGTITKIIDITVTESLDNTVQFGTKKIFDGSLYKNKPTGWRPLQGMEKCWGVYAGSFFQTGHQNKIGFMDWNKLQGVIENIPIGYHIFLDIEGTDPTEADGTNHWGLRYQQVIGNTMQQATYDLYLNKWIEIVNFVKSHTSNPVGIYTTIPNKDYWNPVSNNHTGITNWHTSNDQMIALAAVVDFIAPDIYTHYTDQAGWQTYALANIAEAKKYGKPVYPFLWPQYHPEVPELNGTTIADDYIQMEMQLCLDNADGFIMWGGLDDITINGRNRWHEILTNNMTIP